MDADQFDLIKWTGKCEKAEGNNNHHNQFISAKLFINDLLPEAERDIEKMEQLRNQLIEKCKKDDAMFTRLIILINDMIHLSFRIEVDQGENTSRKGSGRFICDGEDIKAITAAHIVEDESEARNSKVWINFNCPTMIDQKEEMCVENLISSKKKEDYCEIALNFNQEFKNELINIGKRMKTRRIYFLKNLMKRKKNRLFILVSHPHGCSKYVSVGYSLIEDGLPKRNSTSSEEEEKNDFDYYDYKCYDTPSCKGSSGGLLIYLNSENEYVHSSSPGGDNRSSEPINFRALVDDGAFV